LWGFYVKNKKLLPLFWNRGRGWEKAGLNTEKVENRMIEGEFPEPLSLFMISRRSLLFIIILYYI
jgi:hypothetical protein